MAHQKIQSIAGLKVIAIWLIFWWHSWLTNPPCDLGARCCEFFFVASGFLVFISHQNVSKPCTWKASADYVRKKLVSVWPIHFLAFCFYFYCNHGVILRQQCFPLTGLPGFCRLCYSVTFQRRFCSE